MKMLKVNMDFPGIFKERLIAVILNMQGIEFCILIAWALW